MRSLTLLMALACCYSVHAKRIKIAALTPEGTTWATSLKNMAKEIKKATKGKVKFKLYLGGVAGDEPDVLRKIRVGQLSGGIFTGKTLGEISGDIRSMEIPFNFYADRKGAFGTLQKFNADFTRQIESQSLMALGFYEIGMVYVVSTKKVPSIAGLKGLKIWTWEGDELAEAMMESMGLVSVPLALPDVLSSLSTGVIDTAYAPPLAIVAMQWHTKVKYLIDYPVAYSIGSLVLSNKAWKSIPKEFHQTVKDIAKKYIDQANQVTEKDNATAKAQLKNSGIEFLSFPEEDYKKSKSIRADVVRKITAPGKLISKGMVTRLDAEISKLAPVLP